MITILNCQIKIILNSTNETLLFVRFLIMRDFILVVCPYTTIIVFLWYSVHMCDCHRPYVINSYLLICHIFFSAETYTSEIQ